MRDILTVLALLLVLLLSAALAVPYFIDWDAERGLIEAQLSKLIGEQVKIRGGIDLKLLPTPYLQLANVEVRDPAATVDVRADELHLEIALPSLMRGEVDFVEARLVRPQLRLRIENDSLQLPAPAHEFSGQMQFERIAIEDGAVRIDDPATGRSFAFKNIALNANAEALTGPYNADGQFVVGGPPTTFSLSTGQRQGDRLHFKLILDENGTQPRADLDGDLLFRERALPQVNGTLNLSGHIKHPISLPWQASGALTADLRKAAFNNLDLRLGDEAHLLILDGAAQFDFGAKPRADLNLKAQQIDVDKLLTADGAPPPMQRFAQILSDLAQSNQLGSGLPLSLEVTGDSVLLGGETLSSVDAAIAFSEKEKAHLRFAGEGPGNSRLALDGDMETGVAPGYKGNMEASAGDVPRLKQWLDANFPQFWPRQIPPIHSFAMSGEANISEVGFVGSDLDLHLNGSALAGTIAYTRAFGSEAARLFADLSAPALQLDSLPDFSALAGETNGMDLDLRLEAEAAKLGGIEEGDIETGRLSFNFTRSGTSARLENLNVSGFDGADLTASGEWNGSAGRLAVKLDAKRLDGLAGLLQRFSPEPASAFLLAHASDFSPAHLDLSAAAKIDAGVLHFSEFALNGTANRTKLFGKADQDPQKPGDFVLSLAMDAQDSIGLLHQIGISTLPLQDVGPGSIKLSAHGSRKLAAKLTALLAGANFTFEGTVDPDAAAPRAAGTVKLTSADLSGLLRATGLSLPDLTAHLPADLGAKVEAGMDRAIFSDIGGMFAGSKLAGHLAYAKELTGELRTDRLSLGELFALTLGPMQPAKRGALWPEAKFAASPINPPAAHLAVRAATLDLWPQISGRDAKFDLDLTNGGAELGIRNLSAKMGTGSAAADVILRRSGGSVAAQGRLHLADCNFNLPAAGGFLSADLDLAGTGDSAAALVTGLAGSGTIEFSDVLLPKADPAAMGRVFTAVEEDQLGIDEAEIDRVLLSEFGKAPLSLGNRTFDGELAAGVLRLTEKNAPAKKIEPGITASASASLDLRDLTIDQEVLLTLVSLPRNWSGVPPQLTLAWKGNISAPVQTIDAGNFVNALAARAIARESARIQAQEFDVHEHAVFMSRLESERRREQEKLQAEEDALRAAELKALSEEQAKQKAQEPQLPTQTPPTVVPPPGEAPPPKPDKSDAVQPGPSADEHGPQEPAPNSVFPLQVGGPLPLPPRRAPESMPSSILPLQIGRPAPLPPRRPQSSAPATVLVPDPTAAGRY